MHHQFRHHTHNFADLPIWDMLFGTFKIPTAFRGRCGYEDWREDRFDDMLAFRDVHAVGIEKSSPTALFTHVPGLREAVGLPGGEFMKAKVIAVSKRLVVYLAVLALPMLPDRLILFPSTARIDAGRAQRQMVPVGEGAVEVWSARANAGRAGGAPEFYVLRFYGNADRAERWVADEAEMWNGRDVEVWGMNYPGFGGSPGPARLARIGPAALAAFDALKSVAGDRPILVFGASLGTTTALARGGASAGGGFDPAQSAPHSGDDAAATRVVESLAPRRALVAENSARPR